MKIPEGGTTDDISEAQEEQRKRTALPKDVSEILNTSQREQTVRRRTVLGRAANKKLERRDSNLNLYFPPGEGKEIKSLHFSLRTQPADLWT